MADRPILVVFPSSYQMLTAVRSGLLSTLVAQGFRLIVSVPDEALARHLRAARLGDRVGVRVDSAIRAGRREKAIRVLRLVEKMERLGPTRRRRAAATIARRIAGGPVERTFGHLAKGVGPFIPPPILDRLEPRLRRDPELDRLFATERPRLALLGWVGAYGAGPRFVHAARRHGCPTMSLDASWDCMDELPTVPRLDRVLVWNEAMRREAIETQGYAPESVRIVGPLRCDFYRDPRWRLGKDELFESMGLSVERKTIVLATNRGSPELYGACVRALLDHDDAAAFETPIQLILRLHPATPPEEYRRFASDPRVVFYKPFSYLDAAEFSVASVRRAVSSVLHADLVISVLSTLILESMHSSTPNISLRFPELERLYERDFVQPLLAARAFDVVPDTDALVERADAALRSPMVGRETRDAFVASFTGGADGRALERTLEEISLQVRTA